MVGTVRVIILLLMAPAGLFSGVNRATEMRMSGDQAVPRGGRTVEDVFGLWRVVAAGGGPECVIALSRFGTGGLYGVVVETCELPLFRAAKGWRLVDQGFEILDGAGETIGRFHQTGVDDYVATTGAWRISRAPVA